MLKLDQFLPYRLSVASNAVSDRIARIYRARFGLRIPEWRLVAVIAERGDPTQAELVAATAMDKMTVSRAVAALAARGLIARAASPGDRRTQRLTLTAEGSALFAEIAPLALELEARMLESFTRHERAMLTDLLVRLEREACANP
jgi:DNA-binding MarR family transcriptional regulator